MELTKIVLSRCKYELRAETYVANRCHVQVTHSAEEKGDNKLGNINLSFALLDATASGGFGDFEPSNVMPPAQKQIYTPNRVPPVIERSNRLTYAICAN